MVNRSRLRVLELGKYYPPYCGGMETHLKMLCDELSEHVDVTVLVASNQVRTVRNIVDGVSVIRAGTLGCAFSAPICPSLPYLVSRIPADIIHIHVPNPAAILAYFSAAAAKPLVITYHSDVVRQAWSGRIFQPILDRALRKAAIICTSPQYRDSSQSLSEHRERCHVIPLGIKSDDLTTPDPEAVSEIRARYGSRILLSVGRLVYYKGFEYLIQSMKNVAAHLLIVGQGPLRGKLECISREEGVQDRVTFLENVSNLAPYYQASDIFVLPSIARSEAFGIVQLEAMVCGKPVINTYLPTGVPSVSVHGVTGLTVPPADSYALTQAINLLLDRPDLRERFGAAGRLRVRTHFSPGAMAEATLRVYEEALHRSNTKQSLSVV